MIDKQEPAFPIHWENHAEGMTLRDYFAAKAMAAAMVKPELNDRSLDGMAAGAYAVADAMLKARDGH